MPTQTLEELRSWLDDPAVDPKALGRELDAWFEGERGEADAFDIQDELLDPWTAEPARAAQVAAASSYQVAAALLGRTPERAAAVLPVLVAKGDRSEVWTTDLDCLDLSPADLPREVAGSVAEARLAALDAITPAANAVREAAKIMPWVAAARNGKGLVASGPLAAALTGGPLDPLVRAIADALAQTAAELPDDDSRPLRSVFPLAQALAAAPMPLSEAVWAALDLLETSGQANTAGQTREHLRILELVRMETAQ